MDITATDFLKRAANTSEHFGFVPLSSFKKNTVCKNCGTTVNNRASATDRKTDALNGLLTSSINAYSDYKLNALEGPILYYNAEQVPRSGEVALSLQVLGVERSIAEAILIQTVRAIAKDIGFENSVVRINSMGDADSSARYTRELNNFFRKRIELMPGSARELMKDHVISALMHLIEKNHELAYKSPNSLEYLSDPSRKHFREIVEYLDMSETPYEIDPMLLGDNTCYSDALFSLDLLDDNGDRLHHSPLVVKGGRYNNFMNKYLDEPRPAAGAVLVLKEKKAPLRSPGVARKKNPSVYVIQLGFGPKIRSLLLIDELRQAGIPVYQNLSSDSLSEQLRDAENRKVKYAVIIGQKEYVEKNVIFRDISAANQENVPINSLLTRLKRHHAKA